MIAYLLCAGFGTRMRPHTRKTPKSLLPVDGRPLLDYILDDLRLWQDLDTIHVAVNHRDADRFRSWATARRSTLRDDGIDLRIHDDGVSHPDEQLGAVGDLRFLLKVAGLPAEGALVCGGDSLYRFPLAPILNAFEGTSPRVLALHEPDKTLRRQSSTLILDDTRVIGLSEDPADAGTTWICPSCYLFPPSTLTDVAPYLEHGNDPDTLGTLIHALAQKRPLEAIKLPRRPHLRLHCNTPDDLEHARAVLRTESRFLLDEEDVRSCLQP